MILESLLGSLFGGALRLAPEAMKLFDRKAERKHELDLQDKNLALETLRGASKMNEMLAQVESTHLQAVVEAAKAQAQQIGIKFVDALNALVRPVVTYWLVGLFSVAKFAAVIAAVQHGANVADSLALTWGSEDQVLFAGIINFWFVGRVLDKQRS